MTSKSTHRVVIVGGGFGGVFTAKHLRRRAGGDVEIELISRHNFFVFQPLLPEVAGGSIHPADAVSPLRLFLPGVSVRVADVRKIDFPAKTVHVTAGRGGEIIVVPYDHLVIALGEVTDLSRTPGLAERALVVKRRRRIQDPKPDFGVSGGGRYNSGWAAQAAPAHLRGHRRRLLVP